MKVNALKKVVILCAALAAAGTASSFALEADRSSATPRHQEVNGAAKTDRFALPDVVSTVVRNEKADRVYRSPKSDAELKFEPAGADQTVPARKVRSKRNATPAAVDDAAAPVTRANDDPSAVVEPAGNTEGTSRNYAEEPTEKHPSSWSGWSYSKGLLERTDRRARHLWTMINDRYEEGWVR
jgi:hypothetical protein